MQSEKNGRNAEKCTKIHETSVATHIFFRMKCHTTFNKHDIKMLIMCSKRRVRTLIRIILCV